MDKICRKCGKSYPNTSQFFGKAVSCRGGLRRSCKKCKSAYDKHYRQKHSQRIKERSHNSYINNREERLEKCRTYNKNHPEINRRASEKYRENNPEKKKAHQLLNNAVCAGRVVKPDLCSNCKKKRRLEAHHEDYSKPYDVEWLCCKCHNAIPVTQ